MATGKKKPAGESRKAKPTAADLAAAARLRGLWAVRDPAAKITQQTVADELGITQGAISQYLKGDIPLNFRACAAFARVLGKAVTDIRTDLPELAYTEPGSASADGGNVEVPVLSARAAAGHGAVTEDAVIGSLTFKRRSLARKGIDAKTAQAIYVDGDSMVPRLHDGDTVVYDTQDRSIRDGKIYIILWRDEAQVKRLHRELDGRIRIESDHKQDPEFREPRWARPGEPGFDVLGRVRWIGSWED